MGILQEAGFSLTYESFLNSVNRVQLQSFTSREAIWEYDYISNEFFYNKGIVDLFGYTLKEVKANKNWWQNNLHRNDKKRVLAELDELLNSNKSVWWGTYKFKCKDGTYKLIKDHFFVVRDVNKKALRLIGIMQNQSEIEVLQQSLEKTRKQYRKAIVKAIFQAEERDRKNISDELNENINQMLATVNMQIAQAKIFIKKDGLPLLENAQKLLVDSIAGIRAISKKLSPILLKNLGFEISLNDLLNKIPQYKNINYKIWVDEKASDIASDEVQTVLYRIAQQQIKNILQHSTAGFIDVSVKVIRKKIKLTITDNGPGVNTKKINFGYGFNDIQKKMEAFEGSFKISSTEAKAGFTIEVII